MRKGLLGFLRRTLIDLQEKYISIIIKKAWTEQVKDIKTEGKLKVASNNSCYGFQTFILHVFWDAASRYIPFPTPQQPLSPLHLTPTAQHVLSEDFQTMPRGSHSLIFLKIPLSSPLLKNVWKADTKLEKRNKGKKKEAVHIWEWGWCHWFWTGLVGGRRQTEAVWELSIGRLGSVLASCLIKLFCCSNIQMAEEIKGMSGKGRVRVRAHAWVCVREGVLICVLT